MGFSALVRDFIEATEQYALTVNFTTIRQWKLFFTSSFTTADLNVE
jgi:hypothetical protein